MKSWTASWGWSWVLTTDSTDRTVDTHIKTLRIKLQQAAPGSNFIMTHRGMGYSAEV